LTAPRAQKAKPTLLEPLATSDPLAPLPSGVPPTELGLEREGSEIRLPIALMAPAEDEAESLLRAASVAEQPAWWRNAVERKDVTVAVSIGALSLNSQVVPILEAADAAGAHCLAVIAPIASDEGLATLLINDLQGAFPGGILPLGVHSEEFHMDEVVAWIAAQLGIPAWDGRRQNLHLARIASLQATHEGAALHLEAPPTPSLLARATRWLGRR